MVVLVALDEAEHQVPDVEGPTPHSMTVVPVQRLLVLGRVEEGNVAHFIELIHGVLEGRLGSLLIVRPNSQRSIVEVGWEDGLGTIDHDERRVAGGPACAKFIQSIEDPRLEAL